MAAFRFEANDSGLLHQLKGPFPKMQVKDVRLACEQVVASTEPLHCIDDAFNISRCDIIRQLCCGIVSSFNRMEDFAAKRGLLRVQRSIGITVAVEDSNTCVQIPTVVVEWVVRAERGIKSFYLVEIHLLELHETYDHIRDLDTSVVDVVLHLNSVAGGPENIDKAITKNSVADVTDVCGLVGIDACMLNHLFWPTFTGE